MTDHNHDAIARRLKRANGHLEKIIEMIDLGQPCQQIAQQLQAVENAIDSAKQLLIQEHIAHSLDDIGGSRVKARAIVADLKSITKYL